MSGIRRCFVLRGGRPVPEAEARRGHRMEIVPDITPFVSPCDGTVIGSRADRREHNRRNGVADVGNDPAFQRPPPGRAAMLPVGPDIRRAIQELGDD